MGADLEPLVQLAQAQTSAERSLALKSAVLRDTLEHMAQGISMVDADLRLVAWNRRALELLDLPEALFHEGIAFEEVLRFNARRGEYGPGDPEEQVRQRMELARRFEPHVFERVRPDGTVLEICGKPLPGGGFVTTYTDVTARKRAEHLLRLEHSVTRDFAETPDAAAALKAALRAICEAGQWSCGRYLWVDSAAGVLRHGEDWGDGSPNIERYLEDSRRMTYPPGRGLVGTVWVSQQPLWIPDVFDDPRVARKGMARVLGLRAALVVPVTSEGRPIGVLIFQRGEVREPDARLMETVRTIGGQVGQYMKRAQAEQAVRESEARFRSLTALSSDFYWETDAEHRVTRAEHGGEGEHPVVDPAQVGKARWETPSTYPDKAGWAKHRATMDAHLPFRDFEVARVGKDGVERWRSLSGEPMFDASGAFRGYRGVGKDITERKMQQQRIERLSRVYAMLSGINAAIVRVRDRGELYREVCRVAVEEGGFKMAWAGAVRRVERRIEPLAWHGADKAYIRAMPLDLREPGGKSGLPAQAVRERKIVVSDDMASDPRVLLRAQAGEQLVDLQVAGVGEGHRREFTGLERAPSVGHAQGVGLRYAGRSSESGPCDPCARPRGIGRLLARQGGVRGPRALWRAAQLRHADPRRRHPHACAAAQGHRTAAAALAGDRQDQRGVHLGGRRKGALRRAPGARRDDRLHALRHAVGYAGVRHPGPRRPRHRLRPDPLSLECAT